MQRKLLISFLIICALFVGLIGRLMFIEYSSGERYEKIVLSQQEYDSTTIPFQRGNIVDSKGTVLATSVDVYNVILDCKVLNANDATVIASTVEAVAECFPEIGREAVEEELEDNPDSQYSVLAKKVSYEEMSKFTDLQEERREDDDPDNNITGVWFEKEYKRVYPYGSMAAATLGFTTSGNVGVVGLENQYNSVLNGVNGRSYGYLNNDSDLERTVIEAQNGNTLVTTLDANIQSIVEQEILNFNQQYTNENGLGSKNTAVLVMDPDTGGILAMAQYPGFDLNNPWDLSAYYTLEELTAMSEQDQLNILNQLWKNYAVTNTYEPGSTAKPFTVAGGLESGALKGDETFVCDGGEQIAGYNVRCVNRNGHGLETIQDALVNSCNDALMQMSYRIGPVTFSQFQSLFGFGQRTWIDLPGETSTASLIYDEKALESTINLATNSFGQNFNVTMVQMASAFCSLVNGGKLYQPHLVERITDDAGNTVQEIEPVLRKQTISKEVSDQMKQYLRAVVTDGSASAAGVDGYDVGGKTGTAQKFDTETGQRAKGKYLVSFIGYAPQEHPEVLVYVIVDEPNVEDQAHSSYALGIAHNILQQILPYMNISRITEENPQ
ncbi:MAG TPA: penicillin-binding protein 2 [Candidatus Pullilachnospira gallistercoris]|uniref:Penicillin-binding protein 2 n=1 Tax=Candidatus Pullilachnospira gallistercoris TaxID=2840911 RepID=A0A9D1JAA9_9FIRM|nr:penicillin-binding protein 2 [Candidatus Pullilachnospira gallistercoris]